MMRPVAAWDAQANPTAQANAKQNRRMKQMYL